MEKIFVTFRLIKVLGACWDADEFKEAFGEGLELNRENMAAHAPKADISWLAATFLERDHLYEWRKIRKSDDLLIALHLKVDALYREYDDSDYTAYDKFVELRESVYAEINLRDGEIIMDLFEKYGLSERVRNAIKRLAAEDAAEVEVVPVPADPIIGNNTGEPRGFFWEHEDLPF